MAPASEPLAVLFDRAATHYDAERRVLLPDFDRFYGAALAAVGRLAPRARLLDLGAGTGLFAALIAVRTPGLDITLVDVSAGMMAEAERRFAGLDPAPARLTLAVANYASAMPRGPFDVVVSALSIHHLDDAAKQRVYRAAHDRLAPGGVFVNAEQVAGRTPAEEAALDRDWEAAARAAGAGDAMIAAARRRMLHDRAAPLDPQLAWLGQAGFRDVGCPWSRGRFAVLTGRRAG